MAWPWMSDGPKIWFSTKKVSLPLVRVEVVEKGWRSGGVERERVRERKNERRREEGGERREEGGRK